MFQSFEISEDCRILVDDIDDIKRLPNLLETDIDNTN